MTDQPTTRDQLIEQAARVIHAARYTKADEPTAVDEFIAAGLADAGLLADPEQHEPEPRCMNGPAKQHTLHMVGIIKALKAAAELDHLPLEPPRRDNFVRLARAIVDHWPSDIDKPAAPFDLLETEEL